MPALGPTIIAAWLTEFRRSKEYIDGALAQLTDELFFKEPAPGVNSVAVIVKHLDGNMRSRWTDFLTSDGEKPDRNRDGEFEIGAESRVELVRAHEAGWRLVLSTVESLTPDDLARTVTIRGEPMSVPAAVERQVAHYGYHAGQILLIARMVRGSANWSWQTVAPGKSRDYNRQMAARFGDFTGPRPPS